jgi:hypothetical protein
MISKLTKNGGAVTLLLIAMACENQDVSTVSIPLDDSPIFMEFPGKAGNASARVSGSNYAVLSAEYLASEESGQIGRTIYFRDLGNKQLTADFVPGAGLDSTDNVSFYIDENRPSADLAVGLTSAAIARAMNTWDNVTCSSLGIQRVPSKATTTTGFVSYLLGFGGSTEYAADVVHAGWLPGAFFNLIAPNGSTFILGVTFTLIYTDEEGNPTDIDSNGKLDVAFREIYYNDAFRWRNGATVDVETVALHESGHGLSQEHFGQAFQDSGSGSGRLHFSPRAVMNAAYSGVQTSIGTSDLAGHCSLWASWNNN